MKAIRGVLVPLITTFLENGDLDLDGTRKNIARMNKTTISGYFVLGSNGEAAHLSDDEQYAFLKTCRETASRDKLFVTGISRQSAHATIEFGKRAQELGVDYFSVLTPSYFAPAMNDARLIDYYTHVADNLDIPILMYNCPKFAAGITISLDVVGKLAGHPNILGMKDTSSEPIEKYLEYQTSEFAVVSGSINNVVKALEHGSTGGVLSMANFLPDEAESICTLYLSGDREGAHAKAARLIELNRKISGKYGVAGVKCACNLLGFTGGNVRLPLAMPGAEGMEAVKSALLEFGYL